MFLDNIKTLFQISRHLIANFKNVNPPMMSRSFKQPRKTVFDLLKIHQTISTLICVRLLTKEKLATMMYKFVVVMSPRATVHFFDARSALLMPTVKFREILPTIGF